MREVYYNQVANNYIEGPMQPKSLDNGSQQMTSEQAAHSAGIIQDYGPGARLNDTNVLYNEAYDRYD